MRRQLMRRPPTACTPPSYGHTFLIWQVAGKVTLAARVDAFQDRGDGAVGQRFRDEIEVRHVAPPSAWRSPFSLQRGKCFRRGIRVSPPPLSTWQVRATKLQEPPPPKDVRPLPVPPESSGKRRGGRRLRKMKARRI